MSDEETAPQFLERLGMDGHLWTLEFMKSHPGHDEADLIGWFANAIMAGYDAGRSGFAKQEQAMKVVVEQLRLDATDEFLLELADELDPPESVAEADAAEKFSQDCARKKP